ncbi:BON domain-containing protein [Luteimonas panaciterrae]|uniref:BON domain-containing protein n=1 Tax=Luteimonas panaciterrae TaxID=363885 RepID=UPI001CFA8372|nr:BON domain-containing protein [Luteimonas panaciterrae]
MCALFVRNRSRRDGSSYEDANMKSITIVASVLLGSALSLNAMAADSRNGQPQGTEQKESVQPVSDSWITTKVKTELLAARDVSGLKIDVETVNGQVKLSGAVKTQMQVDRAIAVARSVKGVKDVDSSALTVEGSAGH